MLLRTKYPRFGTPMCSIADAHRRSAVFDVHMGPDHVLSAGGDRRAVVRDSRTGVIVAILGSHKKSVKCVRPQPGAPNVIATSSRDGAARIFDLRTQAGGGGQRGEGEEVAPVTTLLGIHHSTTRRKSEASVSALAFAHERENILVTGGVADGAVKFFDLRSLRRRVARANGPLEYCESFFTFTFVCTNNKLFFVFFVLAEDPSSREALSGNFPPAQAVPSSLPKVAPG